MKFLNDFGEQLKKQQYSILFYAIGKKAFVNKLKQLFLGKNKNITFQKKRFSQQETLKMYAESETIVDLVRDNQTGLSFRIFEALGLRKKIITNNFSIQNYDFYTSNNVCLIDENIQFQSNVYTTKYEMLPQNIYDKYSISAWVETVFKLKR